MLKISTFSLPLAAFLNSEHGASVEVLGVRQLSSHCTGLFYRWLLFFRALFVPTLFQILGSSGWRRALLKHWTTWWRWRSVVKSEGCPWYSWQRKIGQLVKFSEACQERKGKKITIANWGSPSPSCPCKPQHRNGFLEKKFLLSNTRPPACNWIGCHWAMKGLEEQQQRHNWKQQTKRKSFFSARKSVNLKRKTSLSFLSAVSWYFIFPW